MNELQRKIAFAFDAEWHMGEQKNENCAWAAAREVLRIAQARIESAPIGDTVTVLIEMREQLSEGT